VLIIVLVLECIAASEPDTYPAPGGEPLWRASRHPRNIRHNANPAETREIRRLPGTSAGVAALSPPLGFTERKDGPEHTLGIKTSPRRAVIFENENEDDDENDYESPLASPS
jgi:hypothetical protein